MSEPSDHLVQQYPAWREALRSFAAQKFKPGDVLTFDWLYAAFLIKRPAKDTPLSEAQSAELQFLSQFKSFEDALLTEQQIALANVRGVGYRVVPPAEQTGWAEREGIIEIKRAIRKLGDRLTNVDLVALDGDQRKQNADALARLGMMGGMLRTNTERRSVMKPDDTD